MVSHSAAPFPNASFLAGLDQREVNSILSVAERQQSLAKCHLLSAGQPATHLFMLSSPWCKSGYLKQKMA